MFGWVQIVIDWVWLCILACTNWLAAVIQAVWMAASEFGTLLQDFMWWILNTFFNFVITDIIIPLIQYISDNYHYDFSQVINGAIDVLIWTNYFVPVDEVLKFTVFITGMAAVVLYVNIVVKVVINLIP
jgi:hypothetical protein